MMQTFALVFCLITQLGVATPAPVAPATPPPATPAPVAPATPPPATPAPGTPATPAVISTTGGPCSDPLCQGLVGAGAGVAGLGAIAGITAGAIAAAQHNAAVATAPPPAFKLGASINTAAPSILAREQEPVAEEGSNWVVPLLLGLLGLCCILGIGAYFCMTKKGKRSAKTREIAPTPMPELAPLMPAPSYSVVAAPAPPVVVSRSVSFEVAPPYGYAMAPPMVQTVAQPYAMAAPAYSMAAPTAVQAFAPTYAGAMDYSGYSVPQGYAMGSVPQGYAMGYPAGAPGYFQGYAEPAAIF